MIRPLACYVLINRQNNMPGFFKLLNGIILSHQKKIVIIRFFPQAIAGINHFRDLFIENTSLNIVLIKESDDPAMLA